MKICDMLKREIYSVFKSAGFKKNGARCRLENDDLIIEVIFSKDRYRNFHQIEVGIWLLSIEPFSKEAAKAYMYNFHIHATLERLIGSGRGLQDLLDFESVFIPNEERLKVVNDLATVAVGELLADWSSIERIKNQFSKEPKLNGFVHRKVKDFLL